MSTEYRIRKVVCERGIDTFNIIEPHEEPTISAHFDAEGTAHEVVVYHHGGRHTPSKVTYTKLVQAWTDA